MRRNIVKWSPCELSYLEAHKDESINQLSGWLGKSRNAITRKIKELNGEVLPSKASGKRTNIGKRADLNGLFLRSSWEANICRLLNYREKKWEYEPDVFIFKGIKQGTVSYCPDIKVYTNKNKTDYIWLEVKGQLKSSDKTRIRRFKKLYPDEFKKLRYIAGSKNTVAARFFDEVGVPAYGQMNDLNKAFKDVIEHWER